MIVTSRKKLDRGLVKKEFMEHNGPKSSVWQAINVKIKRLDNRKEWPKHGQQRVRSLNC